MKRFRPSARRLISIVAAGLAGAAATLFVATAAFAHNAVPTASTQCLPSGGWTITWTITNDHPDSAVLSNVTMTSGGTQGSPFQIVNGASLPGGTGSTLKATLTYPAATTQANLSFGVKWADGWPSATDKPNGILSKSLTKDAPVCVADRDVTFKDNCNGTVTVTLDNPQGNAFTTFKVNGIEKPVQGGQKLDVTVPAGTAEIVVEIPNKDTATHTWQTPTSPCPTTPVTGASLTGTAGVGAGLVVGGVALIGLLLVFRRRRTVAGH